MARIYAAVMALLAMLVTLLRAVKSQAGLDGTITSALVWMAIFGLIGFVVGALAQTTVDESMVRSLTSQSPQQKSQQPTTVT